MFRFFATCTSYLLLSSLGVHAWGDTGHQAVGFIAMDFLAPKALSFVRSSLGAMYNESLGPAATWADKVRATRAYAWSAPFHFVDAEDNPPMSCGVSETRDCGNGSCILTAIANYTTRVVENNLGTRQRQEALKFLGDVGQPLHCEAKARGGNEISAKCRGSSTNLHAVWDSGIINRLLSTTYSDSVSTWADALTTRIKTGAYKSLTSDWLKCSSTTESLSLRRVEDDIAAVLQPRAAAPLKCPLVWAMESNLFVCSTVFGFSSGQDLCTGNYFSNAVPVIELQIAKQGYRLAAWLNVLFDGETHLPR